MAFQAESCSALLDACLHNSEAHVENPISVVALSSNILAFSEKGGQTLLTTSQGTLMFPSFPSSIHWDSSFYVHIYLAEQFSWFSFRFEIHEYLKLRFHGLLILIFVLLM